MMRRLRCGRLALRDLIGRLTSVFVMIRPCRLLTAVKDFDYGFAENGLTAYKLGQELASQSFINFIGEEEYKKFVKFVLHYIADLDEVPVKRGTFVEFRRGMVNISPVGRNAS